ncbi:MAG: DUF6515 family protein [Rikenellaceae bacterium]
MSKIILFAFALFSLSIISTENTFAQNSRKKTEVNKKNNKNNTKQTIKQVSKPKQVTVHTLPPKYVTVKHNGLTYYRSGSNYYKKINSKYVLVAPPVGLITTIANTVLKTIIHNNKTYYTSGGIIYQQKGNNNYVVTQPEYGMIVPELPEVNVREVYVDGTIFFEFENVLYKQIPTSQGVQYQVVGTLNN